MIIDLRVGLPKIKFAIDDFVVTMKFSFATQQYNCWIEHNDQVIVQAKALTLGTDLLEDTQFSQKISTELCVWSRKYPIVGIDNWAGFG